MKMFGVNVRQFYLFSRSLLSIFFIVFCLSSPGQSKDYKISNVEIKGNLRIEASTIESLLDLTDNVDLSAAKLNDSIQDIRDSGLFESVSADVNDGSLLITVIENPTVNAVVFEGNSRFDDDLLRPLVKTL
ncbi:MAG: hypothetical protein OSB27_05680, partial [Planktomarina sp.]|nr:hypothetical protein [Planktomarina sp.]